MTGPVLASALDPAGPAAREIDDLWWFMLIFGTAVFVLFAVILAIGLRRRSAVGDRSVGPQRIWLVGGGVVLPGVGVLIVLVVTLWSMRTTLAEEADEQALTVEATGFQWWYEFSYPDSGVVTANELHIPAGRPVELQLFSEDVIHSFWVPALAGKRDMIPEDVTRLVIEADEPGEYVGQCAEFCGLAHALMGLRVVAQEPEDFEAWVDRQAEPAASPAGAVEQRGQELFFEAGCADCHAIRGTDASGEEGPDLTHLASRSTIAAGVLDATGTDLARWVAEPHDFKSGAKMPAADLDGEQLDAVVAYLESLE